MNLCPICEQLISEYAPTFKFELGFGDFDSIDSMVIHRDCIEGKDPLAILIENFEKF